MDTVKKLMRGYKSSQEEQQRLSGRFRHDDKGKIGYKSAKLDDNAHLVEILEENERLRLENDNLTKKVENRENRILQLEDELQILEEKFENQKTKISTNHQSLPESLQNGHSKSIEAELNEAGDKSTELPLAYRLEHHEVELQIVKDALASLRRCFPITDPFQHTLDTIEQSLATLIERVSAVESTSNGEDISHIFGVNRDHRRNPITSIQDFPIYNSNSQHFISSQDHPTKVVYFLNKSITPFLSSVPKRIGEVTLRDFKIVFDRPGQFRYHFKTLDPEYGMVKEEVLHDDDILPGWDDKIIGWVEDDEI